MNEGGEKNKYGGKSYAVIVAKEYDIINNEKVYSEKPIFVPE